MKLSTMGILLLTISTSMQTFASSERFSGTYTLVSRSGYATYNGNKSSPESMERNCTSSISVVTGLTEAGAAYTGCNDRLSKGCPIVSVLDNNDQFLMSLHDGNSKAIRALSEKATSSESVISNIESGTDEIWARKIERLSSTQIKLSYRDVLKGGVGSSNVKDFDYQCVYQISK